MTLQLLSRRAPTGAILTYIGTVFVTYLSVSILLVLGFTALLDPLQAALETRAANLVLTVLGAGLLGCALFSRKPAQAVRPEPLQLSSTTVGGLVLLGVTVTVMELPTTLPLVGAVGIISSAELSPSVWLPLLVRYSVIFVLPPLLLTFGYRRLGERGGEKLQERMNRGVRETLLWVFGIVGLYLLMMGLDALGVFGDAVTISF